ncbi:MAG: hydroxyacid dehydrogenase [Hyphomicrobium sp. 32-62-53]|nr:MAG: hydroxyacid dehydrogenase [Hyphomicrobium sp. 12-62-95]OYY00279.1 MAG: hydroxyacid dehydrogenase [Hyphomicrobium sp. 32-62-53]
MLQPALNAPTPALLDALTRVVGPAHAVRAGDPAQGKYLREWRDRYVGASPLVVRPGSTAEVAEILRLCHAARTGVVPQSGNTGLVGGQIPFEGGTEIVLSLDRMTAIRAVDADGFTLTAEAGVTLAAVQEAARAVGLMFALSMASEGSACLGGSLATNAGGLSVLAHGTARAQVLGIEAVLADGRVFGGLSSLKKDNTGYDLRDLLIGSEGTLGVITAATVRLVAPPRDVATAFATLPSMDGLVPLFRLAQEQAGPGLTAFEFMSARAMAFVARHGQVAVPGNVDAPCSVLLEVSTAEAERGQPVIEAILAEALDRGLITDARVAASAAQQAAMWRPREQMSDVQKHEGGSIKHDVSLPVSRVPEFLERAAAIVERVCPGARPVPFGHLGDGNVHYNVSQPVGADKAAFLALWEPMSAAIHDLVAGMGGSISAEHGIGRMKRDALRRFKDPVALDMMCAIKSALDPNGILNPGKVL